MVGEACLSSNVCFPWTPDYTPFILGQCLSVCLSEHSYFFLCLCQLYDFPKFYFGMLTSDLFHFLRGAQCFPSAVYSRLSLYRSKGLFEILRDIRISTYQICRIEETIHRTTAFHKWICDLTPEFKWYIEHIVKLRRKLLFFSTIFCYLLLYLHVKQGPDFHFEISGYSR